MYKRQLHVTTLMLQFIRFRRLLLTLAKRLKLLIELLAKLLSRNLKKPQEVKTKTLSLNVLKL